MFGNLQRDQHSPFCGCHLWARGEVYRVKNREADHVAKKYLEFDTIDSFWDWFWNQAFADASSVVFDNFCSYGCWNWVLDFEEVGFFTELFDRYTAAKEFGIRSADSFDDSGFRQLEGLLALHRELSTAQAEKAKQDAQRQNKRIPG